MRSLISFLSSELTGYYFFINLFGILLPNKNNKSKTNRVTKIKKRSDFQNGTFLKDLFSIKDKAYLFRRLKSYGLLRHDYADAMTFNLMKRLRSF